MVRLSLMGSERVVAILDRRKTTKISRVALYARVSTDRQSTENQVRIYRVTRRRRELSDMAPTVSVRRIERPLTSEAASSRTRPVAAARDRQLSRELTIIAAISTLERPLTEKTLTHLGLQVQPPPKGSVRESGMLLTT